MHLNRTSEWKVMTIWICRHHSLYNFECLDISWASIIHPSQKIWLFEFAQRFRVRFWASWHVTGLNRTSESKVTTVWICLALPCLISSVSIYYAAESDIREKSCEHLNFLRASVVQFRASRYIMGLNHTPEITYMAIWVCPELSCSISSVSIYYSLNQTSESKVMAIWIYLLLPCLISSNSMYYGPESKILVKVMPVWISRELSLLIFERLDIS